MAKYIVEQSGPLRGEVTISGSKNAVLPIMAATILSDGVCEINDVPHLLDVDVMCEILRSLGATVTADWKTHTIVVQPGRGNISEVPHELVKKMRASIFVMGPLLAKTGFASIALPGGCSIGNRPIAKGKVNPHLNHVEELYCKDCHHMHKPSQNYCSDCHDDKFLGFKVP